MSGLGVWVGNALVVLGVLLLALRVYFTRQLARIRHVRTGQPIPALDFFEQMGRFFALAGGLTREFSPLGTPPPKLFLKSSIISSFDWRE
jgi:hypothetical protein